MNIYSAAILVSIVLVPFTSVNVNYEIKPETKVELCYDVNRKLNWNDFVVITTKPYNNREVCILSFELSMEGVSSGNSLSRLSVFCKVNKKESWVIEEFQNAAVLNHEQRHFDIAYAYTMKIVKAVKCAETYSQANNIFVKIHAEMERMQIKYDAEAGNVICVEAQKRWDQEVNKMVSENQ